jgi:hypothetical protein
MDSYEYSNGQSGSAKGPEFRFLAEPLLPSEGLYSVS